MSRHRVDHADLAAAGYFTDWSLPAGEAAGFHLSTVDRASTVSVTRLDRAPGAPVDWRISRTGADLTAQAFDRGSWLQMSLAEDLLAADDWGLRLEFRLSEIPRERVLLASRQFELRFDGNGRLCLRSNQGGRDATEAPLPVRQWLVLTVRCRDAHCRDKLIRRAGTYCS